MLYDGVTIRPCWVLNCAIIDIQTSVHRDTSYRKYSTVKSRKLDIQQRQGYWIGIRTYSFFKCEIINCSFWLIMY